MRRWECQDGAMGEGEGERGGGPFSMLAIAVTLPVIFLEGRAEVSVNVAEVSCCVDESKEESESLG